MLITNDIKKIIGGGCEIKEVRYKDEVVWSDMPMYKINIKPKHWGFNNFNISGIPLKNGKTTSIKTIDKYLKFTFTYFGTKETSSVGLYINNMLCYQRDCSGPYLNGYYNCEVSFDLETKLLKLNEVNNLKLEDFLKDR